MSNYKFELWRDIPGYEGLYQISCFGRVKSLARNVYNHANKSAYYVSKEKIKKPAVHRQGYLYVYLCKDSKPKKFYIARLVASSFCEGEYGDLEVNHKDLNKQNNFYTNLEWITPKDNVRHSFKNGQRKILKGPLNPAAVLNWNKVRSIRKDYFSGMKYSDVEKKYKITSGNLSHIIKFTTWKE